jgi:hypothetical protein
VLHAPPSLSSLIWWPRASCTSALSFRGAGLFVGLLHNRAFDTILEASMYCIGSVGRDWPLATQHANAYDQNVPSHIM